MAIDWMNPSVDVIDAMLAGANQRQREIDDLELQISELEAGLRARMRLLKVSDGDIVLIRDSDDGPSLNAHFALRVIEEIKSMGIENVIAVTVPQDGDMASMSKRAMRGLLYHCGVNVDDSDKLRRITSYARKNCGTRWTEKTPEQAIWSDVLKIIDDA